MRTRAALSRASRATANLLSPQPLSFFELVRARQSCRCSETDGGAGIQRRVQLQEEDAPLLPLCLVATTTTTTRSFSTTSSRNGSARGAHVDLLPSPHVCAGGQGESGRGEKRRGPRERQGAPSSVCMCAREGRQSCVESGERRGATHHLLGDVGACDHVLELAKAELAVAVLVRLHHGCGQGERQNQSHPVHPGRQLVSTASSRRGQERGGLTLVDDLLQLLVLHNGAAPSQSVRSRRARRRRKGKGCAP